MCACMCICVRVYYVNDAGESKDIKRNDLLFREITRGVKLTLSVEFTVRVNGVYILKIQTYY